MGSDASSSAGDVSMLEDIPKSEWLTSPMKDSNDPVMSKSSYIEEISSLIEESTKEELNK